MSVFVNAHSDRPATPTHIIIAVDTDHTTVYPTDMLDEIDELE